MSAGGAGPLRLVVALAVAGLVSGLALAGVFLLTQPRIRRNQAEALRAAVFRVLPAAEGFTPVVLREDTLVSDPTIEGPPRPGEVVYAAHDAAGDLVGWAIPAEGPGFQDVITLIYGYDPQRDRVVGMEVLGSRETPGLGDKIAFEPAFKGSFADLAVEPAIVAVKGEPTRPHEVDAITGATISSDAVVAIVNRANERWLPVLRDARQVPAAVDGARPAVPGDGAPPAAGEGGSGP